VAPGVVDLSATITAPFCAGVVEIVGAAAAAGDPALEPEELPLPPHPHIKKPDNTKTLSITAPALTRILQPGEMCSHTSPRLHQSSESSVTSKSAATLSCDDVRPRAKQNSRLDGKSFRLRRRRSHEGQIQKNERPEAQ
jgi:hypothetical protein